MRQWIPDSIKLVLNYFKRHCIFAIVFIFFFTNYARFVLQINELQAAEVLLSLAKGSCSNWSIFPQNKSSVTQNFYCSEYHRNMFKESVIQKTGENEPRSKSQSYLTLDRNLHRNIKFKLHRIKSLTNKESQSSINFDKLQKVPETIPHQNVSSFSPIMNTPNLQVSYIMY